MYQLNQASVVMIACTAQFWNDPIVLQNDDFSLASLYREQDESEIRVTAFFVKVGVASESVSSFVPAN